MSWVDYILAIGVALASEELLGWVDQLAKWLVRHNARQAPKNLSDRLEEEWLACLANIPGKISRLLFALDCRRASYIVSHQVRLPHISPLIPIAVRVFDFTVSLAMLFVTAPTMILAAITIRLSGRGPIFFRQERVGLNGRLFQIWKFRTTNTGGVGFTLVGHFLRRTRIDELPYLFCIVLGTMSFVGPRPERPNFVEAISALVPDYDRRHSVKPGITGLAQISSYPASTAESLKYDLLFIQNYSLAFAIRLILKTTIVVLWGHSTEPKDTDSNPKR